MIIHTEDLVKYFGDVIALDRLNLSIPKGISGLIGPNGAGKTTTINILVGLIKPNIGYARVFDLDCWRCSHQIKQRVGVLHENMVFPPEFTGLHFLKHVARIYKVPNPQKRAFEMLRFVDLDTAKDKLIKGYSAGMLKRLGLAQALIGDPELVILDEPTANLDPFARLQILERIKNLYKDKGINFVISTHVLVELEKICSWVSIINNGKILDQGYLSDLKEKYSANIYKIVTENPERLAHELSEIRSIENCQVEGNVIYCKINNYEFYTDFLTVAARLKTPIKVFQPMYTSLEEVYKEVIQKNEEPISF